MENAHDSHEEQMVSLFLTGASLQRCLASFARDCLGAADPLLHVILTAINSPVQIQLTGVGLQPLQSAEFTLPYHKMTAEQRAFLLALTDKEGWSTHETSMIWRRRGARVTLPPVDVLEAMCAQMLAVRKTHPDPRARVAICNILLQRAQASVPLSKALQAQLNSRLFPERDAAPCMPEQPI
jgi:hypothetical protein